MQATAQTCDQLRREQRTTPQLREEVVVHADPVDSEEFLPNFGNALLQLAPRRDVGHQQIGSWMEARRRPFCFVRWFPERLWRDPLIDSEMQVTDRNSHLLQRSP